MVSIKNKEQIEKMREACRVANLAQKAVEAAIRPGISTWELDKIAERTMRENGAIPAEKWSKRSASISRFNMCICK